MPLALSPRLERITRTVTGRESPLFADDCERLASELRERIAGKRLLVVGGAGTIGAATTVELASLSPEVLLVMDPSENNSVELLRTLRSTAPAYDGEVVVAPLDYGSPLAQRWLERQRPIDLVLVFAALKHVRSERDEFSLLRMLDVNVVAADRFLAACRRTGHGRDGVFFVSTDKAAAPVSMMGASKRAMEALLWAHANAGAPASLLDGGSAAPIDRASSARFANVAFSDGSLPWGFLQRIEKRQPLALPGDVRRYFISPREAGQLCLLAALLCPDQHFLIPRLDPRSDLTTFYAVAAATLREYGLEPAPYDDPAQARQAVAVEIARGRYPVVVTSGDTSGEKEVEIFTAADERPVDVGLLGALAVQGTGGPAGPLVELMRRVDAACRGGSPIPSKRELVRLLGGVVPELCHRETGRVLDARM
jgi:nucleoside-diphosphate-sugar epimerase